MRFNDRAADWKGKGRGGKGGGEKGEKGKKTLISGPLFSVGAALTPVSLTDNHQLLGLNERRRRGGKKDALSLHVAFIS